MKTNNQVKKAVFIMILSSFAFSLMSLFVKLSGDISTPQKSMIRTMVIMAVSYIILKKRGIKIGKIKEPKWLFIRCVAGTAGILLNYYAYDHLILSDAAIIFRISTVMTLVFSYLLLGEKMSKLQFSMVILALIGVGFVVKPEFRSDTIDYIYAVLGAFSAALAYTALRPLGKVMDSGVIVFLFASFTFIILLPYVALNFEPMSLYQTITLILASLCATVGQFAITIAYKDAPAREISIYNYTGIVFSGIFGYFIFNDYPDSISLVGYAIIFASSYIIYKNKKD